MILTRLTHFSAALLAIWAINVSSAYAEINVFSTGARSTALGNASVTAVNVFSAYNNQAALGFLDETIAAIDYQNRFMANELHLASAIYVMPLLNAGTMGVSLCVFGGTRYNEVRCAISMGRRLSRYISLGVQIDYNRIGISGYGSASAIFAEIGILTRPADNLWFGVHAYNFTYSKFFSSPYSEPLPTVFNTGVEYSIIPDVSLFLQGEFRSNQNARIKAGMEYFVLPAFALRGGAVLKPVEIFAGIGYTLRSLVFDLAFARHEVLGYSPQLSLSYILKHR